VARFHVSRFTESPTNFPTQANRRLEWATKPLFVKVKRVNLTLREVPR